MSATLNAGHGTPALAKIVPVRPATGATAAPAEAPAGLLRRTFGRGNPSRRTFGRGNPSRRTFGVYHP
jgi:hypothetical protein